MSTEDTRFTEIYNKYYSKVLTVINAKLHVSSLSGHLAEDIAQDVFKTLWRRWEELQYTTDEMLFKWLLNVTNKKFLELQRSEDVIEHENIDDHERDLEVHGGINDVEEQLDADSMWAGLESLMDPQSCRLLRLITNGYKYRECAAMMGIPLGTVCGMLHRLRKDMKKPDNHKKLEKILGISIKLK